VTELLNHFKHNVIAYLALFVALGGTSYAAIELPVGSVGTRELRNGAVTNHKLARGSVGAADLDHTSIAGYMRDYAQISAGGQLVASRPHAHLVTWRTTGNLPGGLIQWDKPIPSSCFALATTATRGTGATYASASIASAGPKKDGVTYILLSAPEQAVSVAVMCPQR
jgi:hypothetical protein